MEQEIAPNCPPRPFRSNDLAPISLAPPPPQQPPQRPFQRFIPPLTYSGSEPIRTGLPEPLQRVPKLGAPIPMTPPWSNLHSGSLCALRATSSGSLSQSPQCCSYFQHRSSRADQSRSRHSPKSHGVGRSPREGTPTAPLPVPPCSNLRTVRLHGVLTLWSSCCPAPPRQLRSRQDCACRTPKSTTLTTPHSPSPKNLLQGRSVTVHWYLQSMGLPTCQLNKYISTKTPN